MAFNMQFMFIRLFVKFINFFLFAKLMHKVSSVHISSVQRETIFGRFMARDWLCILWILQSMHRRYLENVPFCSPFINVFARFYAVDWYLKWRHETISKYDTEFLISQIFFTTMGKKLTLKVDVFYSFAVSFKRRLWNIHELSNCNFVLWI